VIVRSQPRSRAALKTFAALAAVAIFGIYPAVGALRQGTTFGFPWSDPSTCDGLRYRYEVAREALGAPKEAAARADFASARSSCERYASSLPEAPRSVSCHAAIRTYLRAFRRAEQRIGTPLPAEERQTGWVGASRTLRSRANEILDVDEVRADESQAAAYFDACVG
jgi:hypothetical protein